MNSRLVAVATLFGALSLTACQGGNGEISDNSIPFHQVKHGFVPTKSSLKAKNLGPSQMSAMLKCETPSTTKRLDTENYSIRLTHTLRKKSLGEPQFIESETHGYKTSNGGETFVLTFEKSAGGYGNHSALPLGPVAYTKECSLAEGCVDDEERKYILQSLKYDLLYEKRMTEAYSKAFQEVPRDEYSSLKCSAKSNPDAAKIETTVRQGKIHLSGRDYRAVKIVSKENVDIFCDEIKTGKAFKVGTGQTVQSEIILGDSLPGIPGGLNLSVSSAGPVNTDCARTRLYSGITTVWGSRILTARDQFLSSISINGKVQTVEEFEQSQKDFESNLKSLEKAKTIAQRNFETAQSSFAKAEADLADALRELTIKEGEMDQAKANWKVVKSDANASEQDKAAAESRYKTAVAQHSQAQRVFDRANDTVIQRRNAMDHAELELAKINQEISELKQDIQK